MQLLGRAEGGDEGSVAYLLLGPVSVLGADGHELDLGGAQRRAVLAQLALSAHRVASVDALADGLWGDRPPPTAVKAIQVHVSRLRTVLPTGAIVTRAPGYLLDVAAFDTDVARFDDAIARAARELAAGRPAAAVTCWREGLGLWRGAALADVAEYPFAAAAAVRLEGARRQAVEDRIGAELDLGHHGALVGELEMLVAEDPLRERLWCHLVTALYRCDRQADALDVYTRARHHLVEALGIEPGAELKRLEQEVLHQTLPPPAVDAPGSSSGRRNIVSASVADVLRPGKAVVGRREAFDALGDALTLVAAERRGAIVEVRGDEGLGKSSLVASFCSGGAGDHRTVAGRCREQVVVPYGPWIEVLSQLGADAELNLAQAVDQEEPGLPPERRRARLFDGVVTLLRAASVENPLVVVFDDLHWSDEATVTLLQHVVDELPSMAVLLVLAWRDREILGGHPLTRLVHQLAKSESVALDLPPLGPAEVAELLRLSAPGATPADLARSAEMIHEATAGVPLFVVGAIANLAGTDGARTLAADPVPQLPETVRTLVAGRLAAAGAEAGEVAEACAVLSDPFLADTVAQLLPEVGLPGCLQALDRLVDDGLLHEGVAGYAFEHAAFRHAVHDATRAGRRQTLHAAAYRALAGEAVPAALLAHHGEEAGALVADSEVVHQLRRAGTDAMEQGAFADAAAFLQQAAVRSGEAERPEVLVALADARWRAGDIAEGKAVAAQVVALAGQGRVADQVVADAVVLHGTFGEGYGSDPASIAAAERALEVVTDPEQRSRLLVAIGYHQALWGAPVAVARAAVERANASLPSPISPRLAADAGFAEAISLVGSSELQRRQQGATELVGLGRRSGSSRDLGRGLRMRAMSEMASGDLHRLQETLDELLVVSERVASWLYLIDAWRWRVGVAVAQGDDERAVHGIEELQRLASSRLAGRIFLGNQQLMRYWALGKLEASLAMVEGLLGILPVENPGSTDRRVAELFRLGLLLDLGREHEASAEFERLAPLATMDTASSVRYSAELAITCRVVGRLGRADLAEPLLARMQPFGGQMMVLAWGEGLLGAADRYIAMLTSICSGHTDVTRFQAAIDLERRAGVVIEEERTRVEWAFTDRLLASSVTR